MYHKTLEHKIWRRHMLGGKKEGEGRERERERERERKKQTFSAFPPFIGLNCFPVLAAPLVRSPNSLMDQPCFPGDNPLKLASILANSIFTWAKRTTPKISGPLNSATAAEIKKSVEQEEVYFRRFNYFLRRQPKAITGRNQYTITCKKFRFMLKLEET